MEAYERYPAELLHMMMGFAILLRGCSMERFRAEEWTPVRVIQRAVDACTYMYVYDEMNDYTNTSTLI